MPAASRVAAVFSDIAFIYYALAAHIAPVLVLHGLLLPLNLFRLMQMALMATPDPGRFGAPGLAAYLASSVARRDPSPGGVDLGGGVNRWVFRRAIIRGTAAAWLMSSL